MVCGGCGVMVWCDGVWVGVWCDGVYPTPVLASVFTNMHSQYTGVECHVL